MEEEVCIEEEVCMEEDSSHKQSSVVVTLTKYFFLNLKRIK